MSARWKNRAFKINRELKGRSQELEFGFCLARETFGERGTRYSGRCAEDRKMSARWKNRALKIYRELKGRSHEPESAFGSTKIE
jgi:hypothetical protein